MEDADSAKRKNTEDIRTVPVPVTVSLRFLT